MVGGIGIWTVVAKHSYISLMATSTYPILAYALIAAGGLAVIGSWLGCGGVTSENRCVILVVSTRPAPRRGRNPPAPAGEEVFICPARREKEGL